MPRPSRIAAAAPLALFALLAAAAPAGAGGASPRNYLTIAGRVTDHRGAALPGTWVYCTGSRRGSAVVDSAGRYELEVPGATLEELDRAALRIRVQARRKGWRFALDNGAPELGLEMRVVTDQAKLGHLTVRSNDSSAVNAIVNSVVLDANPRALIQAVFVGSRGAQYDTPPAPLDFQEVVTVTGGSRSIPEAAPLVGGGSDAPAPLVAAPVSPGVTPEPQKSPPPAAVSTPPPATSGATPAAAPQAQAPRAESAPAQPAPASREAPRRLREWNAAGPRDKEAKPRVVRPALGGGDEAPGRDSGKPKVVRPAADTSAAAAGKGSQAPPVGQPPPASQATGPSREGSPVASHPDPTLRAVLQKVVPATTVSPQAASPASPVSTGHPPPAAQPVPRAPTGMPGPATAPPPPSAETCDCTIRGTVEVQSDRPLSSRTEVVLSIEGAPQITTSVELFMGSPRAFEIHPAPCGVHRLLVWTRSKQRFVLVSSEPRVVCTPGGVQQMRLVLEPVARWGAGR